MDYVIRNGKLYRKACVKKAGYGSTRKLPEREIVADDQGRYHIYIDGKRLRLKWDALIAIVPTEI